MAVILPAEELPFGAQPAAPPSQPESPLVALGAAVVAGGLVDTLLQHTDAPYGRAELRRGLNDATSALAAYLQTGDRPPEVPVPERQRHAMMLEAVPRVRVALAQTTAPTLIAGIGIFDLPLGPDEIAGEVLDVFRHAVLIVSGSRQFRPPALVQRCIDCSTPAVPDEAAVVLASAERMTHGDRTDFASILNRSSHLFVYGDAEILEALHGYIPTNYMPTRAPGTDLKVFYATTDDAPGVISRVTRELQARGDSVEFYL